MSVFDAGTTFLAWVAGHQMVSRNLQDIVVGGLAILLGSVFFIQSFSYGIGTSTAMQAGYFPMLISGLVTALGVIIAVKGFYGSGVIHPISWRPLAAVMFSIVIFAVAIKLFGLLPAVILCVGAAALGDTSSRPVPTVLVAATVSLGVWLIFSIGLALPIPLIKGVF